MKMDVKRKQSLPDPVYLVPVVMLLLGLLALPYGYYQLLRLVVCGAAVLIAYRYSETSKPWALAVFVVIALAYNPVFRIHLDRETWSAVNIATVIVFGFAWYASARVPPRS